MNAKTPSEPGEFVRRNAEVGREQREKAREAQERSRVAAEEARVIAEVERRTMAKAVGDTVTTLTTLLARMEAVEQMRRASRNNHDLQ